jgi:uncharacterized protein (DUF1684 family)
MTTTPAVGGDPTGSRIQLELADWRRETTELYARVRADPEPAHAHRLWRQGRDRLFRSHPQSPLAATSPVRHSGLPYWPYDPDLRFDALLRPAVPTALSIDLGAEGTIRLHRIGRIHLPEPINAGLDVWWLHQYAGGLFLPLRDGTAGGDSYGGGRYLLDTAKGADLGGNATSVTVDVNFLYHPSCRYDSRWVCPLAPEGNTVPAPVRAGERM